MGKLVSIIVPIWKSEPHLEECVCSLMKQTYKNLEIILVDDGSPDACPKICDELGKKDSRIVVIHKKNGGLFSARNAGLDIALGEYIAFVNSDDGVAPEFIECLVNNCEKNHGQIAQCDFFMVRDIDRKGTGGNGCTIELLDGKEAYMRCGGENSIDYNVVWNKIYLKTLFEDIRFPVGKIHEDEYTTRKLFLKAECVVYIRELLYFNRQRKNNIMGQTDIQIKSRCDNSVAPYIFPFHRIPFGARIVLYGAGVVGKLFYRQLITTGYCSQITWVDRLALRDIDMVESVDHVSDADIDYIVIANSKKKQVI